MNDHSHHIALALGSNLGDRMAHLRIAVDAIAPYVAIEAISPVYETAPAYVSDQPMFLNAALVGATKLEPLPLLRVLKDLESDLGRQPTFHYGPRLIDIDILFYGEEIVHLPELIIPHPRMGERMFVLKPLADIVPDWRNPANNLTVAEMLAALKEDAPKCVGELQAVA